MHHTVLKKDFLIKQLSSFNGRSGDHDSTTGAQTPRTGKTLPTVSAPAMVMAHYDISQWVDCPVHMNMVTAYDIFQYEGEIFQMVDHFEGSMSAYEYISSLQLNLSIGVP